MSKQVRSARGVIVDFDLMRIKQQLSTAPTPTVVQDAPVLIDSKFKRKIKRLTQHSTSVDSTLPTSQDN